MTWRFCALTAHVRSDCPEQTATEEGGRHPEVRACFDAAGFSLPKQPLEVGPQGRVPDLLCGRTCWTTARNVKGPTR